MKKTEEFMTALEHTKYIYNQWYFENGFFFNPIDV